MTVLKSGGAYTEKHFNWLWEQVARVRSRPGMFLQVLSDISLLYADAIPLEHNLPGWWSKMELFKPDIRGDILYFDLDTLITGQLDDLLDIGELAVLRDFYRPNHIQSSVMYLPESERNEVWREFIKNPKHAMQSCGLGGDQRFLERFWSKRAKRIQDLVPGQVVSYKVHCRDKGVSPEARVICAHGKPKTWDVPEFSKWYSNGNDRVTV